MKLFLTGRRATHSQAIPLRSQGREGDWRDRGAAFAHFTPKTRRLKRSAHSVPVKLSPCPLPGEVFGQIRGLSSRSESSRRKARGGIASEHFGEPRGGEPISSGAVESRHRASGSQTAAFLTGLTRRAAAPGPRPKPETAEVATGPLENF
jgi:hypothetical protein